MGLRAGFVSEKGLEPHAQQGSEQWEERGDLLHGSAVTSLTADLQHVPDSGVLWFSPSQGTLPVSLCLPSNRRGLKGTPCPLYLELLRAKCEEQGAEGWFLVGPSSGAVTVIHLLPVSPLGAGAPTACCRCPQLPPGRTSTVRDFPLLVLLPLA